jgi:GNAT superfamily N-acetyltransferase
MREEKAELKIHKIMCDLPYGEHKWISIVATLGDIVVGAATVNDTQKDIPWISAFSVASGFRRNGIGKAILEAIIELSVRMNKAGLNLWVHEDNTGAQRLYLSVGFMKCGTTGEDGNMMMYRPTKLDAPIPVTEG